MERIIAPICWVLLGGWHYAKHFSLSLKFDEQKRPPTLHSTENLEAFEVNTLGSEMMQAWPITCFISHIVPQHPQMTQ